MQETPNEDIFDLSLKALSEAGTKERTGKYWLELFDSFKHVVCRLENAKLVGVLSLLQKAAEVASDGEKDYKAVRLFMLVLRSAAEKNDNFVETASRHRSHITTRTTRQNAPFLEALKTAPSDVKSVIHDIFFTSPE